MLCRDGDSRKDALAVLQALPVEFAEARRRVRPRLYGADEVALLRLVWEVADGICGKRLASFLPTLPEKLAACDALPEEATPRW